MRSLPVGLKERTRRFLLLGLAARMAFAAPHALPTVQAAAKVYLERDVDKSPLLRQHEVPKPELAPGQFFRITVTWTVTEKGMVKDAEVVESASPEIDALVLAAVRKWRYEPGEYKGKRVAVRVLRKYTFGKPPSDEPKVAWVRPPRAPAK